MPLPHPAHCYSTRRANDRTAPRDNLGSAACISDQTPVAASRTSARSNSQGSTTSTSRTGVVRGTTGRGVRGWPNRVPMTAISSPEGTPTSGTSRRCPVRAPVVARVITGRRASTPDTVARPRVRRSTTRSTWWSVLANSHAPSLRRNAPPSCPGRGLGDVEDWSGAGRDGEHLPFAGDALEDVTASVVERDATAGNEVAHR